jgi:WD repeat-containing protein 1 (actin-interacting protein 1)
MSAELKDLYAPAPVTERGKAVHLGKGTKNDDIVYCTGNNVFWRSVSNPLKADMYSEHQTATTCARYSPSGNYMATGDAHGTVRVWATDNEEKILKIELKVLGGAIKDICWSEDSQRIAVCGDGSDRFGAVFMWDSGSSVGEISGHAKSINAIDFKQTRPFRVVTASEDAAVNWFEGPPFKYKGSKKDHSRFVNCVRFSPDGSKFLSVSSDKTGFFYDGKTGEKLDYALNGDMHKAGIYSIAWSSDSKQVATCSADKTIKVWDAENGTCVKTFSPGGDKPGVNDMQVGLIWNNDELVSLSLSGALNYNDFDNVNAPKKIVYGHNKFVKALAFDASSGKFYTGSYDALMLEWDVETGNNKGFSGTGHGNEITRIRIQGDNIVSGARDDTVRITPKSGSYDEGASVSCDGQVEDVACHGADLVLAAARNEVAIIRGGKKVGALGGIDWEPTCVAISHSGETAAVGSKDNKIRLYTIGQDSLAETKVLDGLRGSPTRLSFSNDDKTLATCDSNRDILLWDMATHGIKQRGWEFHTAVVRDLTWSPDNLHLASASLDGCIFVWSVEQPTKRIKIHQAHKGGCNAVEWVNDVTLLSIGDDCTAKTWSVSHH